MKNQSTIALSIPDNVRSTSAVKEITVSQAQRLQNRIDAIRTLMDNDLKEKESLIRLYNDHIILKSDCNKGSQLIKRFGNCINGEIEYINNRLSVGNDELKKLLAELHSIMEE